ncbi:Hypothetical predicted protein [Octopus vulgaris]|uniref:Uncharacterized protein n=1 Tax=Octopus vulgaris TaxID=6645 RepID=A0AA36BDY4_OCTVU|nr:Hypothetical predicted protein [Octopus vulgaris]
MKILNHNNLEAFTNVYLGVRINDIHSFGYHFEVYFGEKHAASYSTTLTSICLFDILEKPDPQKHVV